MTETITGLLAALVIILLSRLLSRYLTTRLFSATVLVAIAFIYVGFSLKDNPAELIILECNIALLFYFMAVIGYTRNRLWIAAGIVLHGVWDILHHQADPVSTRIPAYWPPFCLVIDFVTGIYFFILFKKEQGQAALS